MSRPLEILITGGCGFVGSHMAGHFIGAGNAKVGMTGDQDSVFPTNAERLRCRFVEGSVADALVSTQTAVASGRIQSDVPIDAFRIFDLRDSASAGR